MLILLFYTHSPTHKADPARRVRLGFLLSLRFHKLSGQTNDSHNSLVCVCLCSTGCTMYGKEQEQDVRVRTVQSPSSAWKGVTGHWAWKRKRFSWDSWDSSFVCFKTFSSVTRFCTIFVPCHSPDEFNSPLIATRSSRSDGTKTKKLLGIRYKYPVRYRGHPFFSRTGITTKQGTRRC